MKRPRLVDERSLTCFLRGWSGPKLQGNPPVLGKLLRLSWLCLQQSRWKNQQILYLWLHRRLLTFP